MPARAIASGNISFGLVSIPIKLYAASQSKAVHFNWLDPRDKSRVKQQYINASTNEPVERSSLVRGYEYTRGQYVIFSEEELKALERKSDRSIEIEEFVPIAEVDPIYYEGASLLGPDKGGAKAYRLLWDAMQETGRVAVGRYSTRGRQQLVLLRPWGPGLVLHGLAYADEVRTFDEIELDGDVKLKEAERALARQLVEQLANNKFEPTKYEDEYRQAVLAAVDRKVAGEEVVAAPAEAPREQIIDLVAALKKSLAERGGERVGPKRVRPAKPSRVRRSGSR
jgi:DNA end-binding protein Ku